MGTSRSAGLWSRAVLQGADAALPVAHHTPLAISIESSPAPHACAGEDGTEEPAAPPRGTVPAGASCGPRSRATRRAGAVLHAWRAVERLSHVGYYKNEPGLTI